MDDISYTIDIKREGDGYSAWAEGAKKVIKGPCASAHGKTPLEAAEKAYQALVSLIAEESELTVAAEIDAKWDELIPDSFNCTDELEVVVKTLIAMVREGMTELEQQRTAGWIDKALAEIIVVRCFKKK
jgi:hypothetical protein